LLYAAATVATAPTTQTSSSSLFTGEVTVHRTVSLSDDQRSQNNNAQVITTTIGNYQYTPVMAIMCTECMNQYKVLTVFKCACCYIGYTVSKNVAFSF